jgi:hypothetical protein
MMMLLMKKLQLQHYAVPAIQSQVPFFYSSRQRRGQCDGGAAGTAGAAGDGGADDEGASAGAVGGVHDDGRTFVVSRGRLGRS